MATLNVMVRNRARWTTRAVTTVSCGNDVETTMGMMNKLWVNKKVSGKIIDHYRASIH